MRAILFLGLFGRILPTSFCLFIRNAAPITCPFALDLLTGGLFAPVNGGVRFVDVGFLSLVGGFTI